MKKSAAIVLMVLIGILIFGIITWGGIYNQLVSGEEKVSTAWAQVQNVYQRRLDLIPNLVETVKGYAAHEKETLEKVIEARAQATKVDLSTEQIADNPELLAKFQEAQRGLSSALSRLLLVVEQYPNLKADQNFLALQSQLEGTENRITVERMRFNEAARDFNTLRRTVPHIFVAKFSGFKEKAYFQAEAGSEKAPAVKF
ncbi:MAG: LemA family protein [Candidatus Omnitrophica bacterium]|nr:LemA family protein [Candidatus Omnitrophota bacterium]